MLIILRGNSGSGKTTVAKELQKRFGRNTMLISQDNIRREMLNVEDGKDTKAIPLMKQLLEYGNEHSDVVILEGIMNADWYHSLFEFAAELFGKEIYAYYFDVPFEETLKRHQTRSKSQEFGEKEMRRWWREKDFSDVLNEKRITSDMSMESIVTEIYRKALVKSFLGKTVNIKIDRPMGSRHPRHPEMIYPVNYGFIPNVYSGDGAELDVYLLGVDVPVREYTASVIGIIYREDDVEDKLVAAPNGIRFSKEEIQTAVNFQEQFFKQTIELL